jgi:hypothetical protein
MATRIAIYVEPQITYTTANPSRTRLVVRLRLAVWKLLTGGGDGGCGITVEDIR